MRTTASIVTYHTDGEELRKALRRLELSAVERVYVVDNGSEQRIREICNEFLKTVYIPSLNRGYGAGHNQAIRRALDSRAEYHLVINSDIVFRPKDIASMTEYLESNQDVGALHPRIYGLDGKDQYTIRLLPTPFDLIIRRFFPNNWFSRRIDRYLLKEHDHDQPLDVHYAQGSFLMLRLATLRKVGLFDERFFMYPEDIDLSRRIAEVSKLRYLPKWYVIHAHRQESYHSFRMLRIHIINIIRYYYKWGWIIDLGRIRANRSLRRK